MEQRGTRRQRFCVFVVARSPHLRQMEQGVVVTKYGKKGTPAQRVLFLDAETMSVAWRELDARSPGHRRAASLTNMLKGQREALALSHLDEVSKVGLGFLLSL